MCWRLIDLWEVFGLLSGTATAAMRCGLQRSHSTFTDGGNDNGKPSEMVEESSSEFWIFISFVIAISFVFMGDQ